jgi:hypothetical protein
LIKERAMRELNGSEITDITGGGWIVDAVRGSLVGQVTVDTFKIVLNGFGPASSSTAGFGLVGPGSRSATDPSSIDAVNGSDRQSDCALG